MTVLPLQLQVLRLLLAPVLGGLVGVERERKDHGAGLRTHALVCLGSALVIIVSTYGFSAAQGAVGVALDPSRVSAQVVSGVGFLGAGTIIVQGRTVRGLTTAASIWMVAAIGLATGAGLYIPALIGTLLALLILVPLQFFERRVIHHEHINLASSPTFHRHRDGTIGTAATGTGIHVAGERELVRAVEPDGTSQRRRLTIELEAESAEAVEALVERLQALDGAHRIVVRPRRKRQRRSRRHPRPG